MQPHSPIYLLFQVLFAATLAVSCQTNQHTAAASAVKDTEGDAFTLSGDIYDGSHVGFTPHEGNSAYLVKNISFPPVAALREQLEPTLPFAIKNRGEAHITVITPVEYESTLKAHLSMRDIDSLAVAAHISTMPFEAVCVGDGSAVLSGRSEHTYYIVVKSDALLALRRQIAAAFERKGGEGGAFNADDFWPHITLGFTKRDLFNEDGVMKDEASCIHALQITGRAR